MKLYQKIARVASQKNKSLKEKELALLQELLPYGNGIETGCVISLKSTHKRIVIDIAYGHPNYTDDITTYQVVITPSFEEGINVRITGKNKDKLIEWLQKQYLQAIFREALMQEYVVFKKGWEIKDSSEIESELDYVLD